MTIIDIAAYGASLLVMLASMTLPVGKGGR